MTEKAYLQKIEEHKGIILKVVNLYADDLEDRKDLYQEIVFQSWSAYARFEGNSKFSTWLYRISLNVALTFLNKLKRQPGSKRIRRLKPLTNHQNYLKGWIFYIEPLNN